MKYELYRKVKINGCTLWQIKALRDFGDVKKGDLGGFIDAETSLDQYDDTWVYKNACIYGKTWFCGNTCVYDGIYVYKNVRIYNNAHNSCCSLNI